MKKKVILFVVSPKIVNFALFLRKTERYYAIFNGHYICRRRTSGRQKQNLS